LGAFNDGPLPGSPLSAYYGYRNVDRQEIELDAFTATIDHALSADVNVRNLTRWQQVDQFLVVDPPQGTWCLESGINPWTGAACAAPGTYQPSGPRGNVRDTTNQILVNQTDFTLQFDTGAIRHTLVTGFSFSSESYHRDNGNVLRNPLGATPNPTLPVMSIANPDNLHAGPVNFVANQIVDGEVDNRAAYIFDRLQLTERFEINGGLRYEHNDASSTLARIAIPYPTPPAQPVLTQDPLARNVDDLASYRIGLVYKPSESSSVYLAHGNSETPSQSSVNGACDLVESCNVDPEEAEILEIGAKWEIAGQLTLTGSIFRNERNSFRVDSVDPSIPEQQLDGSSRVDGIALGAAGQVGEKWSVFSNYTYLDSELIQNIDDVAVGSGTVDFRAGDPLPNTPEHSASFWATYQASAAFTVGFGTTYQGEYTFNRANGTAELFYTPDYWVTRAMAAYAFNDNLALRINVDNLTDEAYFERVRNNATNGWATPGAGRFAVVSVTWRL
jgi:catecholate siderophore receptor